LVHRRSFHLVPADSLWNPDRTPSTFGVRSSNIEASARVPRRVFVSAYVARTYARTVASKPTTFPNPARTHKPSRKVRPCFGSARRWHVRESRDRDLGKSEKLHPQQAGSVLGGFGLDERRHNNRRDDDAGFRSRQIGIPRPKDSATGLDQMNAWLDAILWSDMGGPRRQRAHEGPPPPW